MSRSEQSAFDDFVAHHGVGDVVSGRVTKELPFGAFVEVADGVHGLLVGEQRPAAGSNISVQIQEIDADRQRLSFQSA